MKSIYLLLLLFSLIVFSACNDDDDDTPKTYEYHAHIHQPSSSAKNIGDLIAISVEFESHTGEDVEHINVRIYDKVTNLVVYDEPADAHVSNGSATYEFEDQVTLSTVIGFFPGIWVLEAKVWGKDDDQDLVSEKIEFQIN